MVVMKFGGTSVQDVAAINRVAEIVSGRMDREPVVVVSAMARVTEALLHVAQVAKERRVDAALECINELRERHLTTARTLLAQSQEFPLDAVERDVKNQFSELDNLVRSVATLGELTARSQDAIVSFGELFFLVIRRQAISTLFPYTTHFRCE